MITDDELLAACAVAGKPGTRSHAEAQRLYRKAAAEWRRRQAAAERRVESSLAAGLDGVIAGIAQAVLEEARKRKPRPPVKRKSRCGTYGGYLRHCRTRTRICQRCEWAMQKYARPRYRARKAAAKAAAAAQGLAA